MADNDPVLSELRKERDKLLAEIKTLRDENVELQGAVRGSVLKDVGVPEKARARLANLYDGEEWTPSAVREWIEENGLAAILTGEPEAPPVDPADQHRRDAQARQEQLRQVGAPPSGAPPSLEDRIAEANQRIASGDLGAIHDLALLNSELAAAQR